MINIVFATDDNFVQHCSVAIASVLANNKGVSFYIFTEGLRLDNENSLKELAKKMGGQLTICPIESDIVSQFPMPSYMSSHISIATYYRLFVERVLPKNIDRVIYMDCDMVVRGSLQPLWNTDMTDKAIGAVYQFNAWAIKNNSFERLSYDAKYGYFNAGMLLINLAYWRENKVTEQLMSFIKENYSQIHSHDQDVLNAVLHRCVKPLSYTWNCLPSFFAKGGLSFPSFVDYSEDIDSPVVIHYVYKPKPWQYACSHPYKKEYFKYLDMTAYKGWRPKFDWQEYKEYKLKRKVRRFLGRIGVSRYKPYR